jgi:hypothetical protein
MMETSKLPKYDIWLKDDGADCLPAGAIHVCSYDLNLGAELVLELLFLNRLQDVDELWSVTTFSEKLLEEIDDNIPAYGEKTPRVLTVGRPLQTARAGSQEELCRTMIDLFGY